jgi:hypothetical protein
MSEQVLLDREAPPWAQRLQTDINSLLTRLDRRVKTVNDTMSSGSTSLQGQIDDLVDDVTALQAVLPLTSGTYTAVSGASVDITGIPAGVRLITIVYSLVSTNGTSPPVILIGDSGGIETTGYISQVAAVAAGGATAAGSSSSAFMLAAGWAATYTHSGTATLALANPAANAWSFSTQGTRDLTSEAPNFGSGSKSLSGVLDRIRLTTQGGVNTFDGGGINIYYQ